MASAEIYPRLFTVEEANDLLPTLRPLVKRIFDGLGLLRRQSAEVIRDRRLAPESPDLMARLQENEGIARLIQEIKGLADEIQSFGCLCKGIEEGLIDFPCMLGDEIVFLCWRFGEQSVEYWHRAEDGFAGRRPLLDAEEEEGGGGACH